MQSKNPFGPVPPSTNPFDAPPERRIPQPMAGVMVQPAVAASAVVVQSSPVAVEIAPPVALPSPPKAPKAPQALTFEGAERLLKDYTDRDRHQKVLNACNEFINQAEEARALTALDRRTAFFGSDRVSPSVGTRSLPTRLRSILEGKEKPSKRSYK